MSALTHTDRIVFDHRTIQACKFDEAASRVLPLLETRVLPVAMLGDTVILSLGRAMPVELPLLRRLGFGPDDSDLLFVAEDLNGAALLPIDPHATIYPFTATSPLSHALHRAARCRFHGCRQRVAIKANLKSTLQRWYDECIPVPEGSAVSDGEQTKFMIADLLTRHTSVVFKPDFSASGIGHRTFWRGEPLDETSLEQTLMLPGIVQARVEKDMDVSVQFRVDPVTADADGPHEGPSIHILEITGQYVSEHGEYQGGFFPVSGLSSALTDHIKMAVWKAVSRLVHAEGYWGPGSVDVLVNTRTNRFWLVDVNARVSAMWYPLQMIHRRLGRVLPFSMRSFQIPVGLPIGVLEEVFHDYFFSFDKNEGFVPFAFLPEVGFCYGVVFAEDPDRCLALDKSIVQAEQLLRIAS